MGDRDGFVDSSGDALELAFKLEFSQRRLEETLVLVAQLRETMNGLIDEAGDLSQRNATLKVVQEKLLAEKLAAEATAEALLHEKAELSGENASLRAHSKDVARTLAAYSAADGLVSAATGGNTPGGWAGVDASGVEASPSALRARLAAARLLLVRLLELTRRHGLLLSNDPLAHLLGGDVGGNSGALASAQPLRAEAVAALADALRVGAEVRAASGVDAAAFPSDGRGLDIVPPPPSGAGGAGMGAGAIAAGPFLGGGEAGRGAHADARGREGEGGSSTPPPLAPFLLPPPPATSWWGRLFSALVGDVASETELAAEEAERRASKAAQTDADTAAREALEAEALAASSPHPLEVEVSR